jgi:predicted ATPase
VDTQGDAFFVAFPHPEGALRSARAITETLASTPIRVRIGIHSGVPHLTSTGYVGQDVHRAARIAACAHGGQVVCSEMTADLLADTPLLASLGSHRLKDFPEPVRLFQLGEGAFPPLKTIANTNLPTPASSFLGREAELYEADLLLQRARLLSIVGPGGAGKTRFALELARRAREDRFSDYEDGVFSCFLASLRDSALVLPTFAQTLALREEPGADALETLVTHLQDKRLLLVLDNLEHLLACAPVVAELLAACPGLILLCTSRELLRIQGERAFELPPLAEVESVELFCERAQVEPSQSIAELCRQLEGLPLAIELAAARSRLLSPEQLLSRLSGRLDLLKAGRDADPRQQTLRATIQWSYDLLSEEEQRLFRSLSVFAGGCTLEAAEEVCRADLDALASLLDKSLLRRSDDRFWMLETIREFGADCLEKSGDASELAEKHSRYFTLVAEAAEPHLSGREQRVWAERLDAEYDNLRAALARSLEVDHRELALRLAAGVWRFWDLRSHFREGRQWLAAALDGAESLPASLRAKALNGAGALAGATGDLTRARLLQEESLRFAREARDRQVEANALGDLGVIAAREGGYERSVELFEQAKVLFVELDDDHGFVLTLGNQGTLHNAAGHIALAEELLEEAVKRARQLGIEGLLAHSLTQLGDLRLEQGDFGRARQLIHEALGLASECRDHTVALYNLHLLAIEAAQSALPLRAAVLAGAAEEIAREVGCSWDPEDAALLEKHKQSARASVGEAAFSSAWAQGAAMSFDEAITYALESPPVTAVQPKPRR